MDWAQVLVIILSVFLAIFLLLAIVLLVMLITVTRQIKNVTQSAQRTVEHMEEVVAGAAKFSTPLALIRTIMKYASKRKRKQKE